MCRSGAEALAGGGTCDPRRCPSSGGAYRRAADRARYRLARIAQTLGGKVASDAPSDINPPQAAPSIMDIRAAQSRVEEAWEALESHTNREQNLAIYEERVREMGQAIHERAVAMNGLDTTPAQVYLDQHAERLREPVAERERLIAKMGDYSRRFREPGGLTNEEKEAWQEASRQADACGARIRELESERAQAAHDRHVARVAAYRGTLAEVQSLGGAVEMSEVMDGTTYRAARRAVSEVGTTTPTVWLDQSNATHAALPLYVRPSKGRAHYTSRTWAPIGESAPTTSRTFVSDDDQPPSWMKPRRGHKWKRLEEGGEDWNAYGAVEGQSMWVLEGPRRKAEVLASVLTVSGSTDKERERVARHEFSHRIEGLNRRVSTACLEFRRRRTTNEDGTREARSPIYGRRSEPGWRDGFVTHYVGRDYGPTTDHSEVFSMGSESVWNGTHGSLEGDYPNTVADPEHRNLILGLYATAK